MMRLMADNLPVYVVRIVLRRLYEVYKQSVKLRTLERFISCYDLRVQMLLHHPAVPSEFITVWKEGKNFVPTHPKGAQCGQS